MSTRWNSDDWEDIKAKTTAKIASKRKELEAAGKTAAEYDFIRGEIAICNWVIDLDKKPKVMQPVTPFKY